MKPINIITLLACLGASVSALGCATTTTDELVRARTAYQKAAHGPTNDVEPEHVIEAHRALERAEREHDENPGSGMEAHFAYTAERKAQQAIAKADFTMARRDEDAADRAFVDLAEKDRRAARDALRNRQTTLTTLREDLRRVRAELSMQGDQLSERTKELRAKEQELAAKIGKLEEERSRRMAAETQLMTALESLEELASVRAEENKLVITLSGSVLFEFGRSEVMPIAEERLSAVVEYLEQLDPEKKIKVIGHTDSIGSDSVNEALSRSRAESVKRFLVDKGIDSERIETVGMGEQRPLADNGTPEGRAYNRRVEIEIEK